MAPAKLLIGLLALAGASLAGADDWRIGRGSFYGNDA